MLHRSMCKRSTRSALDVIYDWTGILTPLQANCSRCKFLCKYDPKTGQPIGYHHQPDPNGRRCCPGTQNDLQCYPKGSLLKNCKPVKPFKDCFDCYYECDICHTFHPKFCRNPGIGTLRMVKSDSKSCCGGTPKPFEGNCPTKRPDEGVKERGFDQPKQL